MLAWLFPPMGGAGVQRTVKYVKYLPGHGWDPVVVTTDSTAYPVRDASLLADIPQSAVVLRARDPRVWRAYAWMAARAPWPSMAQTLLWPDASAGWIPAAVRMALRAVRQYEPAVLYSTSSPESTHFAAGFVAALTGLPWVADFRDEWLYNPWRQDRARHLKAITRRAERGIIRRADRLVYAAPWFQLADPAAGAKAVTITNGVDPDDVPDGLPGPGPDRFRVVFVGTLYEDLDAAPVTAALARLAARGTLEATRSELRIVGNIWIPGKVDAGAVQITETGYLGHREAVREMAQASVLLLYVPGTSRATTQKVFEYLATGRPILCVTRRDNEAFRLVEEFGAGVCVEPEDAAGIDLGLERLYRGWLEGGLPGRPEVRAEALRRFSRRRLAGDLAAVLDEATR
jgi:glycosyltransferase involved in cell wall biosynthesis